ncbi:MAG: hypothetical protein WDN45_09675 [Caulobacteraceae bacterium]
MRPAPPWRRRAPPKKAVPQSPYAKDFVGTWDRVGSINFDRPSPSTSRTVRR